MKTVARQPLAHSEKKQRGANYAFSKSLRIGGACAVLLVLLMNLIIMERQEPWEDEIFAVSTGWSLARSQGATLSVLADYPKTGSPISFYGPVSFEAEALLIRVFGLSLHAWRLACFLGILLCVFVSSRLVKLAGGDRWAQLITALIIALSVSVGATLPGRWDAVSAGLFLIGLLVFLGGLETEGRFSMRRCFLAGVLIGLALASTPRVLTLSLAVFVATVVTGLYFAKFRSFFLLSSFGMFLTAFSVQTLLLLPWGESSISWYTFLKHATRGDSINATPLNGQGAWSLDMRHHKIIALLLFAILISWMLNATARKPHTDLEKRPLKVFLGVFAVTNLVLMLLVLANTLGQPTFWLPPVICAAMCWFKWDPHRRGTVTVAVTLPLATLCLLFLFLEEAEQAAVLALTWNRRSTVALTDFVRRTIPPASVVYGPIGGYFYPVELSGSQYLYPYERTTPGLYSKSPPGRDRLDERICSHRSYVMWPKPNPAEHPETQLMPQALRERLREPVAEFDQPALTEWRTFLLKKIGGVGGKYGFPDAVIYSLGSSHCGAR